MEMDPAAAMVDGAVAERLEVCDMSMCDLLLITEDVQNRIDWKGSRGTQTSEEDDRKGNHRIL